MDTPASIGPVGDPFQARNRRHWRGVRGPETHVSRPLSGSRLGFGSGTPSHISRGRRSALFAVSGPRVASSTAHSTSMVYLQGRPSSRMNAFPIGLPRLSSLSVLVPSLCLCLLWFNAIELDQLTVIYWQVHSFNNHYSFTQLPTILSSITLPL